MRAALPGAGALGDEGIIRGAAMGAAACSPESVEKKFGSAREEKKVLAHLGKVSSRASQGGVRVGI